SLDAELFLERLEVVRLVVEKLLREPRVFEMKGFDGHYSLNQFRSRESKTLASLLESWPTIFTASLSSTVAICALMPEGTFNPAAFHSTRGRSVFASTDEMGTRNKSLPFLPMTIAGRTLRLVKSVNGIGRRTTSFLEQFIEDVVGVVAPRYQQGRLGKLQPVLAFSVTGFNGYADAGFFGQ